MGYNKWYVSGDTHANFSRFHALKDEKDIAVIVLGDTALNWNLNEHDTSLKASLGKRWPEITWYILRGNHDARPSAVQNMKTDWDDEVQGYIMYEPDFLNIRYLLDGGEYIIDGHSVLTIGGAYSVDKYYRLANGFRWFSDEQLTEKEMRNIENIVRSKNYDFVMTHTCPYSWRPVDLFLSGLDQSTVDNTMELWLEGLKDAFTWNIWLFGHYHADRLERPHVEQYFNTIEELSTIWNRWNDENRELEWWIRKAPNYYMGA